MEKSTAANFFGEQVANSQWIFDEQSFYGWPAFTEYSQNVHFSHANWICREYLCEQPANILRSFSEHESRVQIRYAANILPPFCKYTANMDSKLLTEYAANNLQTFCKYAAIMDAKLQIEYVANILRKFLE